MGLLKSRSERRCRGLRLTLEVHSLLPREWEEEEVGEWLVGRCGV